MSSFNNKFLSLTVMAATSLSLTMPVSAQTARLEEIVVTAQKREQSLQDTPIAVTAFSKKELERRNITDLSEIAEFTPSLVFDATAPLSGASTAAVVFIRGVGQSSFQVTDDPGVGTYVDGVYIGSAVGGVLDVIDVERIEILRGPQGTLFGRNTIGGAINVTSARPDPEGGSSVEVTAGNFNRINVRAGSNLPFAENLTGKISASYKRADGWLELLTPEGFTGSDVASRSQDIPGNDNEGAVRFSLDYQANDNVNLYLTVDASRVREASAASGLLGVTTSDPSQQGNVPADAFAVNFGILADNYNAVSAPNIDVPGLGTNILYDDRFVPDNPARQSFRTGPNGTDVDTDGISLSIAWDISDNLEFKSITSLRNVDAALNRDADGSPLTITHCFNDFEHEQYSQEFQLSGLAFNNKLTWLAGVYYFEEDAVDDFRCELGGVPGLAPVFEPAFLQLTASVENDSTAAFAQGTYAFNDDWSFTFGGRFTEDTKTLLPEFVFVDNFTDRNPITPFNIPPINEQADFDDFSIRAGVDFQVNDSLLLYASYSEGFKSGGFSSRTLVARDNALAFEPEELATIELGAKYQSPNGKLRVNGALFTSDYDSIQGVVIEGIAPGTQNTGDAEIDGFELEVTGLVTDNFQINASFSYLDDQYTSLAQLTDDVAFNGRIELDDQLPNTPEFSGSISLDYSIPLTSGGELTIRGDLSFYDEIFNDDLNSLALLQPAYELIGGQVSYTSADDSWSLALWGKNLADEEYIVSGDDNVFLGFREANFGTPRTYGVTLRREF